MNKGNEHLRIIGPRWIMAYDLLLSSDVGSSWRLGLRS